MRSSTKECVGRKYGRLTVIAVYASDGVTYVRCVCDCGVICEQKQLKSLIQGNTKSCGCLHRETSAVNGSKANRTHGCSKNPRTGYGSWRAMRKRCLCTTYHAYENYGGRGIKICERWLDFSNFISDMGTPKEGDTIERVNVNGNYEPGNCVWVPRKMQSRNRRTCRKITYNGATKTLIDWCRELNIGKTKFYGLLHTHGEANVIAAIKGDHAKASA